MLVISFVCFVHSWFCYVKLHFLSLIFSGVCNYLYSNMLHLSSDSNSIFTFSYNLFVCFTLPFVFSVSNGFSGFTLCLVGKVRLHFFCFFHFVLPLSTSSFLSHLVLFLSYRVSHLLPIIIFLFPLRFFLFVFSLTLLSSFSVSFPPS